MVNKAIIVTGGVGNRISSLTGGVIPKGLCRVLDKPLVAYQIYAFRSKGLNNFLISTNSDWQSQLVRNSIRIGEFPKANYIIKQHKYGSPLFVFSNPDIAKFIKDSPSFLSFGDLYFRGDLVATMLDVHKKFNSIVFCEPAEIYPHIPDKKLHYCKRTTVP